MLARSLVGLRSRKSPFSTNVQLLTTDGTNCHYYPIRIQFFMPNKIVEIFSDNVSSEWLEKIINFCRLAYDENKHEARNNMQVEGWQNAPSCLLYILNIEKRFSRHNGGLQLLVNDQDVIMAISGYYRSDFAPEIYIMGVRSWVLKEFRHNLLIADFLLSYQLSEIKKRKAHFAIITFNESTLAFAKLIERSNKYPQAKNKFFFGDKYPELYKDMRLWPSPLKIKNVKQWILIKDLADSHFDWSALSWNESD